MITLENIKELQKELSVIKRVRVTGSNTVPRYRLLNTLEITLSNGDFIVIPEGFEWDLSSVPRQVWNIIAPDGDGEIAALIHDFLYVNLLYTRKFADEEMYKWGKAASGTTKKWSLRNLDNWVRYQAVKLFGWTVWNKNVKKRKQINLK